MKVLKTILIALALIVFVIIGFGLKTYWSAGEFRSIEPHFSGDCQVVKGVMSSEDITIHPTIGLVFISSDDRRLTLTGQAAKQGAIYAYSLRAEKPTLLNFTADFKKEFHPHGIGLYITNDFRVFLFVVNHTKDGHFVEKFQYKGNKLVHMETIKGPLMTSPNDVIPVGERSFYVTNDHGKPTGFWRTVEEYLQIPWSYVLYYDGNSFQKVAEDLAYANGINISPDGKTIYVAATISSGVFVYDRDIKSGALKFRNFINAETGVDNIEIDKEGNLWIGAHPKLLTFVDYAKDPEEKSPSQVIKITPGDKGSFSLKEIYLNDGTPMSGSSVAAVYKDKLLIGSVFDDRFLLCTGAE
ncbi:strictosidine synthase family protein [Thermodesulfobacteriota bacterium]